MAGIKKKYFITGSDTGVGKTIVTASLMAALQQMGNRCIPVKPIQTGCEESDDLAWCLQFSDINIDDAERAKLNLYRFPLPASPHLAAKEAGVEISVSEIVRSVDELSSRWDTLLIEGAGGLLVPINNHATMFDLMKELGASPIVVTRSSLGTLNHTALTLNELRRNDINPAAIVISNITATTNPQDIIIREDNVEQIRKLAGLIPVIEFDFCEAITKDWILQAGRELIAALS